MIGLPGGRRRPAPGQSRTSLILFLVVDNFGVDDLFLRAARRRPRAVVRRGALGPARRGLLAGLGPGLLVEDLGQLVGGAGEGFHRAS